MIYPQSITSIYEKLLELEDQGFEEVATTNCIEELTEIEKEMLALESVLDDLCTEYELEYNNGINHDRHDDLYRQCKGI